MIRRATFLAAVALVAGVALTASAQASEPPCELEPRTACFGIESIQASLSTTQAGAHPNLTFSFGMKQDPESELNEFGIRDGYATLRDVRFELPPGLVGDPNVLGVTQQCTAQELFSWFDGGGCPNASQIGRSAIFGYELNSIFVEPLYMMVPPANSDVVARLGTIAGVYPTFIDVRLRSESDYGITSELVDAPTAARLTRAETTLWGVPSDPSHDKERCTPVEVFGGCTESPARPPGGRALPFLTNPTRCGAPLDIRVGASSWNAPNTFDSKSAAFPAISGCDKLPFGPSLTVKPTSHRAASPTGADVTIELPASEQSSSGHEVLEPSQMRKVRVQLPQGLAVNPSSGDGLETCSSAQVGIGTSKASQCPDAAKLADTEFEIPALERNLRGAAYLREPTPGDPFRFWLTADDLGLHVKLPGELRLDRGSGQIESVVLDPSAEAEGLLQTEGIPQAPVRKAKLQFKSGFRAPLVTPDRCGEYRTSSEFIPWSGGPAARNSSPMTIDEGCDTGRFSPSFVAGTTEPTAGAHSPFVFTLSREDGEQNPEGLDISLPTGFVATFAGIPRCLGAAAETGSCPAGSRIGKVVAAVGAGPHPLWVPQQGKRPTAVYLSGPYHGTPLSIVAVAPRQAGPFDFGDEVIRSAISVDPTTARATAHTDPLPQLIEGIPIGYRKIHVMLDRKGFALNPTSCAAKETEAVVTSSQGAVARPTSPFAAVNCARLGFKPKLSLRLKGGTKRGGHPKLRAVLRTKQGPDSKTPEANIRSAVVRLPRSAFLDQAHIGTVCTRVQFAAHQCPSRSVYGHASVKTPLLDEVLSGPVYLRSSDHELPDLVIALKGPDSIPIEVHLVGRVDSLKGAIRTSFESAPDAPVAQFTLEMFGGKKGLIINSRNLCDKPSHVTAQFTGQNGKFFESRPVLKADCKRGGKK